MLRSPLVRLRPDQTWRSPSCGCESPVGTPPSCHLCHTPVGRSGKTRQVRHYSGKDFIYECWHCLMYVLALHKKVIFKKKSIMRDYVSDVDFSYCFLYCFQRLISTIKVVVSFLCVRKQPRTLKGQFRFLIFSFLLLSLYIKGYQQSPLSCYYYEQVICLYKYVQRVDVKELCLTLSMLSLGLLVLSWRERVRADLRWCFRFPSPLPPLVVPS